MTDIPTIATIADLKRPSDASLYIWAPTGDAALAKATNSLMRVVQDVVRQGGDQGARFRFQLPQPLPDFHESIMVETKAFETITFQLEVFQHDRVWSREWAARFVDLADVARWNDAHKPAPSE